MNETSRPAGRAFAARDGLRPRRRARFPEWASTSAVCLVVVLSAAGTGHAGIGLGPDRARTMRAYEARIAELETIMVRFYRGESIEETRKRHSSLVDEHNQRAAARRREVKAAEAKLERELEPQRNFEKEIEEIDARLERKPDPSDRDAVGRYNILVARRNAFVKRYNRLNKRTRVKMDVYNKQVARLNSELKTSGGELDAMRKTLDARIDAYEAFEEAEKGLAFFRDLNRLYAELHGERRRGVRTVRLDRAIARLRGMRRELGARAMGEHERREFGLIVVEVTLGASESGQGELCFLVLDTGAMRTTVEPGLVRALGLALGEETEFTLAGGEKLKGRKIVLPSVSVAGVTERDVPAAAVKASEVGVDGLLGQTFLKRFVYAIDESREGKLILRRREEE